MLGESQTVHMVSNWQIFAQQLDEKSA